MNKIHTGIHNVLPTSGAYLPENHQSERIKPQNEAIELSTVAGIIVRLEPKAKYITRLCTIRSDVLSSLPVNLIGRFM